MEQIQGEFEFITCENVSVRSELECQPFQNVVIKEENVYDEYKSDEHDNICNGNSILEQNKYDENDSEEEDNFSSAWIKKENIQSENAQEISRKQVKIRYICNTCKKTFANSTNLRRHKILHTGQKPYSCNVCKKKFSQSGYLNRHALLHTGEKPHQCEVCSRTFADSSNLQRHRRRRHAKRIENGIPVGDHETESNEHEDIRHASKNGKRVKKTIPCKFCGKLFARIDVLKKHVRIHTGEKPYVCKLCKRKFTQSASLRRHERIHSDTALSKKLTAASC